MSWRPKANSPPSARLRTVLAAGLSRPVVRPAPTGTAAEDDAKEWVLSISVNPESKLPPPSKEGRDLEGEPVVLKESSEGNYLVEIKMTGLKMATNRDGYGRALASAAATLVDVGEWQPLWRNDSYVCGDPSASYHHIVAMSKGPATPQLKAKMADAGFDFKDDRLVERLFGGEALPFSFKRASTSVDGDGEVVGITYDMAFATAEAEPEPEPEAEEPDDGQELFNQLENFGERA